MSAQTYKSGRLLRGTTGKASIITRERKGKNMSERETGIVKWFNGAKGFGFIQRQEGEDVFVHFSSIRGEGYRNLEEGQTVEFGVEQGPKGLRAVDVTVVGW